MARMKWIVMLVLAAALVSAPGCKTTGPSVGGSTGPLLADCAWINAPGPWVDNWNKEHPNEADRYLWMVGVSDAMPSGASLQHARRSAEEHAVDGLVAKLGITVSTMQLTGRDWTNETRQLVIGMYKQALKTQMAEHNVNLDPYLWCGVDKVDPTVIVGKSYVEHGLFRLDKGLLTQSVAKKTADGFEKKIEEHRELTQKAQKEAVDRARELTKKWSESLLVPKKD